MCYLIKVGCSVASQGEGRRHVVGCLENEFQTLKKSKLNKILFFYSLSYTAKAHSLFIWVERRAWLLLYFLTIAISRDRLALL